MQTNLVTVPPDMPLSEVSDLLFRHRISGAPVVAEGVEGSSTAVLGVISRADLVRFPLYQGTVSGILSEHFRDLTAAEGVSDQGANLPEDLQDMLSQHTAREAMAMGPVSVAPDTEIREVARMLVSRHLHRALVVEGTELVGLISALDVVGLVADGRAG